MKWIFFFALLPLVVQAQTTFGPVRLDGGVAEAYYYPQVNVSAENQLLCTWTSYAQRVKSNGQAAGFDGSLVGPRMVYEDVDRGQLTCAPELTILPTASGGEARLYFHS